jgi:oligosaccharide repeat unit polymerase
MIKISVLLYLVWPALALCYVPNKFTAVAFILIMVYVSPLMLIQERVNDFEIRNYRSLYLRLVSIANILIGIANIGLVAIQTGNSPFDLFTVEKISIISQKSTVQRYANDADSIASGSALLLSLNLFLIYFCGRQAHQYKAFGKAVFFIPLVIYSLLTTAKFPAYLAISFYLVGAMCKYSSSNIVWRSLGKPFLFLAVVGAIVLIVAMSIRGHQIESADILMVVGNYLFSQFCAFGIWLIELGGAEQCCQFGQVSFIGPISMMGLAERPIGIYDSYIKIYEYETNIYTAWRFLIEDFSLLGPLLLNISLAFAYTFAEARKISILCSMIRHYLLLSSLLIFTTGIFVYNSVAFAFFFSVCYNLMNSNRRNQNLISKL